jgi:hypothetical protein
MMKKGNKDVFSAVAVSGTTAYTSTAMSIELCNGFCGVLTTTGTATGTLKLQASNDNVLYVDLPNSGTTANIAVSGAGSHLFNVINVYYNYIRCVYTNATNTGTVTLNMNIKGV